jgi:putative transposase
MVKILYWYLKKELHRSRAWAYKWLKRFDNEGLEGLKDRPRSGRPPDIPEEKMLKKSYQKTH